MKKTICLTAAAVLLTVGGFAAAENACADGDGVKIKISGDARLRAFYKHKFDFGNKHTGRDGGYGHAKKQSDSRVRVRIRAETPGGAYAVGRIRIADGINENNDTDSGAGAAGSTWADEAYIGVPLAEGFTLEVGKYRVTYGTGFYYENLPVGGARAIIKAGDWTLHPFVEWQSESAADWNNAGEDRYWDHDSIRYGLHAGFKASDDWRFGGMVAYQTDDRDDLFNAAGVRTATQHKGWMASVYADGKSGPFGLKAEFAYNDGSLKFFNTLTNDHHATITNDLTKGLDYDAGFGGYIQPSYTIDALTLALQAGFVIDGFTPDVEFGFVMLGSNQLRLRVMTPGEFGSMWWAGLIAKYALTDSLTLTGNFVYADQDGDARLGVIDERRRYSAMEHAFELSGSLDWAVSKGANITLFFGTLFASFEDDMENDNPWGSMLRFTLKF